MTLEEGIRSFLARQPAISAIVESRIYPMRLPERVKNRGKGQSNLPAIVYQKISGGRELSHSGSSKLANPRVQFNAWSQDYLASKLLAKTIVDVLHGFKGVMGDVEVQYTSIELELDVFDDRTRLYNTLVDVVFWHREKLS